MSGLPAKDAHVVVVVLGDTGRSPRMQFHASSLASLPGVARVSLIGYEGERLIAPLRSNSKVKDCRIGMWLMNVLRRVPLLGIALKGAALVCWLLFLLCTVPPYQLVLIQNPPCIPAVVVAWLMSKCNGSRIIVDWHNLGFSMFLTEAGDVRRAVKEGLTAPLPSRFASMTRLFEAQLWWMCHAHICVSEQMAGWLRQHLGLKHVAVLYDRPPNAIFDNMFVKPTVSNEPNLEDSHQLARRHELLLRLGLTDAALFPHLKPRQTAATASSRQINKTVLTEEVLSEKGTPKRRIDSAAFLVSSTSWTPDEDFTILERCLRNIDAALEANALLHADAAGTGMPARLVVVVTGKGPKRDAFLASLGVKNNLSAKDTLLPGQPLKRVAVVALWLEPEDYPLLLSCAHLGVCLHTSTSGLDLPMKVLDMFGAGVPVCAVRYGDVLSELVKDNINGCIFDDSDQLTSLVMQILFPLQANAVDRLETVRSMSGANSRQAQLGSRIRRSGSSSDYELLKYLQHGARVQISCWEDNWDVCMRPVVIDQLLVKIPPRRSYVESFLTLLRSFFVINLIFILLVLILFLAVY